MLFSLNVHDWVFAEKSAETVGRVLDIHEQYQVPIEIFLTDPVVHAYEEVAPELLERLRDSDMASVSYHVRPPYPYASEFDWQRLNKMSAEERYDLLYEYETHAVDLQTGEPTAQEGGYANLKKILGYAPRIVGMYDRNAGGTELARIYKDLGAQMIVQRQDASDLGEVRDGLWMRPEHYDLKVYEFARRNMSAQEVCQIALDGVAGIETPFIGIKYHENNFYADIVPWKYWYYDQPENGTPLEPPYTLDESGFEDLVRSEREQSQHWQWYESVVKYVAESGVLVPLSTEDVLQLENN